MNQSIKQSIYLARGIGVVVVLLSSPLQVVDNHFYYEIKTILSQVRHLTFGRRARKGAGTTKHNILFLHFSCIVAREKKSPLILQSSSNKVWYHIKFMLLLLL